MNAKALENTIRRCRERNVVIPTYEQMKHPETIPESVLGRLKQVGLWDLDPVNLFRITWKNDPKTGGFGKVNFVEFPSELTGVKAKVVALVGKFFPTGAHKVGATFGPLVSRLVSGEFDPTTQKAVWPSTGNYCRGGAFNSYLLGCDAIAILPEGMSRERFEWLKKVGAEIIATYGSESNVKEIYDKCHELERTRGNQVVILNQFAEFMNPLWHYEVTGSAMQEVMESEFGPDFRLAGMVASTGSAGTIAAGDFLRTRWPHIRVCASEALQCPTLLYNGFGTHRIEGIGDKHVPWIHNIHNTDVVVGIDDEDTIRLIRLFNEPEGRSFLAQKGVAPEFIEKLGLVGISGVCNLLSAIKMAKHFEMDEHDVVFTVLTDSMELYGSRIEELQAERGSYTGVQAAIDFDRCLLGQKTDWLQELSYMDRKRIHNLKYFTWVEQQGFTVEELNAQWFERGYWARQFGQAGALNQEIIKFNAQVAGK